MSATAEYHELQRLPRGFSVGLIVGWIVWAGLVLALAIQWNGTALGNRPISIPALAILILVYGAGLVYMASFRTLKTVVNAESINVRLGGFRAIFPLKDITELRETAVNPLAEYGGWGFRIAFGQRRAYIASSRQGVSMILRSGRSVFIGSEHQTELAAFIRLKL
ncbi:hypothetical protein [Deinococcus sp.]|uniref:hypothetical protein n=1 Tax=Deinococcus sp. TaxID=47478 RepID=UPI0025FE185B|nr:hypothetical protein [Deinococcus sp.]